MVAPLISQWKDRDKGIKKAVVGLFIPLHPIRPC